MKIIQKKQKIKALLERSEMYRNDYGILIARIWFDELQESNKLATTTISEFLKLLANNKVTHPETIMRTRRKIQEENPHLRGISYQERQTTIQEAVKKDLGYGK